MNIGKRLENNMKESISNCRLGVNKVIVKKTANTLYFINMKTACNELFTDYEVSQILNIDVLQYQSLLKNLGGIAYTDIYFDSIEKTEKVLYKILLLKKEGVV